MHELKDFFFAMTSKTGVHSCNSTILDLSNSSGSVRNSELTLSLQNDRLVFDLNKSKDQLFDPNWIQLYKWKWKYRKVWGYIENKNFWNYTIYHHRNSKPISRPLGLDRQTAKPETLYLVRGRSFPPSSRFLLSLSVSLTFSLSNLLSDHPLITLSNFIQDRTVFISPIRCRKEEYGSFRS